MPLIQHPQFPHIVQEVPAGEVKDWTDQGWSRVKVDDEQKAQAVAELARRAGQ